MCELTIDQLPQAEREAIERERRILKTELDCLLHFAGLPKLNEGGRDERRSNQPL